jgi:hypothetical protein
LAVVGSTLFGVMALAAAPGSAAIRPAEQMPVPGALSAGATQAVDGATVGGWLQINDDVSADPLVNCTSGLSTLQRGGITRFDVIPGSSAAAAPSNTVLAANKVPASSSIRAVTSANGYWNTFGRDRGTYTIKPTYHARVAGLPCAKASTTVAGPTGPAGGSCPDGAFRSYVTGLFLGIEIPTIQCPPLNALGAATPGTPITVNVDNRSELTLSPATDQNSQMGEVTTFTATAVLRSAHYELGSTINKPALANKPVLFTVDGPGGYTVGPVLTSSTGVATAQITTAGLSARRRSSSSPTTPWPPRSRCPPRSSGTSPSRSQPRFAAPAATCRRRVSCSSPSARRRSTCR